MAGSIQEIHENANAAYALQCDPTEELEMSSKETYQQQCGRGMWKDLKLERFSFPHKHSEVNHKAEIWILAATTPPRVWYFCRLPTLSCRAFRSLKASPADIHLRLQLSLLQPDYGKIPKYLSHIKKDIDAEYEYIRQLQQQREQEEADRMRPLLEDERHHLIEGLKTKWESVNTAYQGGTHITKLDTMGKMKRKERHEAELSQIEKDIEKLSKKNIIINADECARRLSGAENLAEQCLDLEAYRYGMLECQRLTVADISLAFTLQGPMQKAKSGPGRVAKDLSAYREVASHQLTSSWCKDAVFHDTGTESSGIARQPLLCIAAWPLESIQRVMAMAKSSLECWVPLPGLQHDVSLLVLALKRNDAKPPSSAGNESTIPNRKCALDRICDGMSAVSQPAYEPVQVHDTTKGNEEFSEETRLLRKLQAKKAGELLSGQAMKVNQGTQFEGANRGPEREADSSEFVVMKFYPLSSLSQQVSYLVHKFAGPDLTPENFEEHSFGNLFIQSQKKTGRQWTNIGSLRPGMKDSLLWIRARVHNSRKQGNKLCFLTLRQDVATVQAVIFGQEMAGFAGNLPDESVVDVYGKVACPDAPITSCTVQNVELALERIFCIGRSQALPLQLADASRSEAELEKDPSLPSVGQDVRLDHRIIDLRTVANQAVFRMQSGVCMLFREFLLMNDFQEIHTPKLIGGASEGGADVFRVDYFEGDAFLAQSPQLYKQMALMTDMPRVFEVGPIFRSEKSFTHRHMTEFTGLDLEMTFKDHYHEVLDVLDGLFNHIFTGLTEKFAREIEAVKTQYPLEDLKWKHPCLRLKCPRPRC
ncbi:aspS1 [Symbiodinium sp. KB8]|nr:aspS1 [Symbiodinium sp. KB8]